MIHTQTFTTIGKSTSLKGNFNFVGTTHLLGTLTGEITMEGNAKIILEIGSHTDGILQCSDVEIYGEFTGEIRSTGIVTFYPTAVVSGKIIAKSMEILPGAVINISGHTES